MQRCLMFILCVFAASAARAQVLDVTVGITPACPYGLSACWGGAEQGLTRMSGVLSVTHKPDAGNSLAEVKLASNVLPDLTKWSDQFRSIVGQVYAFRGVEVVVRGTITRAASGDLQLQVPGIKDPLTLLAMRHKLQWNYQQAKPKAILPEELAAIANLKMLLDTRPGHPLIVRVTGPLASTPAVVGHAATLPALEVRTFTIDDGHTPTTMSAATTKPSAAAH